MDQSGAGGERGALGLCETRVRRGAHGNQPFPLSVQDLEHVARKAIDLLGGDPDHNLARSCQSIEEGLSLGVIGDDLVTDHRPIRTDGQHHVGVVDGGLAVACSLKGGEGFQLHAKGVGELFGGPGIRPWTD